MTTVTKNNFGFVNGKEIYSFTIKNENGMSVSVCNYGGLVLSVMAPDKNGCFGEVTLGYDTIEGYINGEGYFGAAIGRIGNRIAGGEFTLNGRSYSLFKNDEPNHLHGGKHGFNCRIWDSEIVDGGVKLSYFSPDGEEGYPGNLSVSIVYTLTESNALSIEYSAISDADTILSLTNHSYFNLAGGGADSNANVLSQELRIAASHFTPVDSTLIPTGELRPVDGTPFDFHSFRPIGERINADDEQIKYGSGYDHNFVFDSGCEFALCCEARCAENGRLMRVYTDQPGVQLYTGNVITCAEGAGRGGRTYQINDGFCLETQHYPDSIHHSNFPSVVVKAGEKYFTRTVYEFSVM
ncbi:MAG: galactose mutarotase [Oscillospiraceae bacterium]|nr:galactose mutarotase [Oscillospiraceae bacterium]